MTWVPKGWGGELWIQNNDLYCGKKLFLLSGKQCSVHYHKIKDETFYVASGDVLLRYITVGEIEELRNLGYTDIRIASGYLQSKLLRPGDSFHVPPFMWHRFRGNSDAVIFEFSTHHDDADSYRIIKGD